MRILLLTVWLAASLAPAATIDFTGLPPNHDFGTYNGFLTATVDGRTNQLLLCDDYSRTTYVPSAGLTFYVSTLDGEDPLEHVRFASPYNEAATLMNYREAAFLLNGLLLAGSGSPIDLTADYQYAIWHLFTPSVPIGSRARQLLEDAASSVHHAAGSDSLYSRLLVYTPTAHYASNQEFLQLLPPPGPPSGPNTPANATPEPSPAVLILGGTLLVVVSAYAGRLRREAKLRNNPPGSAR